MSAETGHPLALLRRRLPSTSLDASMLRGNSRNERYAMHWSPGPDMNSVAVLLAHLAGVLQEGLDLARSAPPRRVRAQEFQTRGALSADMLRRVDAVVDDARDTLPRLSLTDLDNVRQDEDGTVTCGWVLLHALDHAYLHLGHVQITCQLWRQREQ